MVFGSNVAKSTHSLEIIFSLTHGGTVGSYMSGLTPGNGEWCTLLLATGAGSSMVTNVEGVMLNGGPNCCGCSEASDKASVGSTATGVELYNTGY